MDSRPLERRSDAELIAAAKGGQSGAFSALVARYEPRIFGLARRIVKDEAEARDVVQNVMLALFRNLKRFDDRAAFSTWLHRISTNAALEVLRRRAHRSSLESSEAARRAAGPARGHASTGGRHLAPAPRGDAELRRREKQAALASALDALPAGARRVLQLYDIEGLSVEQLAACLGISPGAARVRVHRARELLRRELADASAISSRPRRRAAPAD